jgi:tetratricopeptide (TPR) repeat protein
MEEEFTKLQNGIRSINEFVAKINPLINELINEQKWKGIIGAEHTNALRSLLINLTTQVKTYNDMEKLGNNQQAKTELNNSQIVIYKLIDEIDLILPDVSKTVRPSVLEKTKDLFFKDEHKFFVGRKKYIDKLIYEAIKTPNSCVSIIGIGGSGKTQLAYQAMRKYESEKLFDVIIPVYFDVGAINFSDFLFKLSKGLRSVDEREFAKNTVAQNINNIITELYSKKHPLIYLDNYETIAYPLNNHVSPSTDIIDISNFLNDRITANTSIFLTSRERNNRITGRKEIPIELKGLNQSEAINMFSRLVNRDTLKNPDTDTKNKIRKLLEKIDGHPLLIEIISKNITTVGQLDGMMKNIDIQQINIGEKTSRLQTIEACFGYTINLLNPKLQDILCNLLFFKSAFLPDAASSIFGITEEDLVNLYNRMLLKRVDSYVSTSTKIQLNHLYHMYGFHPGTRTYLENRCQFKSRTEEIISKRKEEYVNYFDDFLKNLANQYAKKDHLQYYTIFKIISESDDNDFLRVIEITRDDFKKSDIFRYFGVGHEILGDYKKALKYHQKALEIDKELNYPVGLGRDYTSIGLAHHELGDYKKALEYHQKALEIDKELNYPVGLSRDYTNIGNVTTELGDYKKALEYHQKALEIDKELNYKIGLSRDYANIGTSYSDLADYKKALEYHQKALEIHTELNSKWGIGSDYINIGVDFDGLGDYEKALEYHQKALEIHTEMYDMIRLGKDYINIGSVYSRRGDYEKALEYHQKALSILESLKKTTGYDDKLLSVAKERISELRNNQIN